MFYNFAKGIVFIFQKLFFRIEIYGKENIPMSGRLILCSNHHSNWDPVTLAVFFPRQVHWMAKKELFKNKIFAKLLFSLGVFPVDREGNDLTAIKKSLRILKEERVLGIFPEGTRVKYFNDDFIKSGLALIAVKSQSPVLPVYSEGNYKLFSKIKIIIGHPIYIELEDNVKLSNEKYTEISKDIMRKVYELGG
ncbi:1-acyl-sn-glycerol-3-phosphate acyltransferase [Soehngenia longivitae]|uniref:1-acyl-sn-glycerol-3-phosphate acyltransferase n=1 Tax=Soehngenia longivitae TaxID=2562294 RepID=A0A4Z0D368_9FIRM|nr:lysophospholipid acyltransferase family protein [Soehngenia longivitae]TFZ39778.1 1-acyl-sn-glycerol-3-phosphate acyltransferase [Soehngenia longivitae]